MNRILKQWSRAIVTADLWLLGLAIIFSTTLLLTLNSLSSRLQQNVDINEARAIAGDFRISHPALEGNYDELRKIAHKHVDNIEQMSTIMEFNTMVYRTDGSGEDESADTGILSAIKAVDEAYPLKGSVEVDLFDQDAFPLLSNGTAWVDKEFLLNANLQLGDSIWINDHRVKVTGVLVYEPDRLTSTGFAFAPRVMISLDDIHEVDILIEGSRLYHLLLFTTKNAQITTEQSESLEQELQDRKLGEKLSLPQTDESVDGISQLLILMNLLTMLLCGFTLMSSAIRFASKQYRFIAILSAFNMSHQKILRFYLINIAIFSSILLILGFMLAYWLDTYLAAELERITQIPTVPTSWAEKLILSSLLIVALIVSIGYPLGRIVKLDVVKLLHRAKAEALDGTTSFWLLGSGLVLLMLFVFIDTLQLLIWLGAVVLLIAVAIAIALPVLSLLSRLFVRSGTALLKVTGLSMQANRRLMSVQFATVVVVLFPLLLTATIEEQFFERWETIVTEDRPNFFLINIFPDDIDPLREFFELEQIDANAPVPEIRMRLNDLPDTAESEWLEQRRNTSVRLSIANELPASNEIVQGEFWDEDFSGLQVSIAENFAENSGLKLGERIVLNYGGVSYTFTVTSVRKVEWTSMNINFWLLVKPEQVADLPRTYLSSINLSEKSDEQTQHYRTVFREKFPNILLLSIEAILTQTQQQLSEVTRLLTVVVAAIAITSIMALTQITISSAFQLEFFSALCRLMGAGALRANGAIILSLILTCTIAGTIAGGLAQIGSVIWFDLQGFATDILWPYLVFGASLGAGLLLLSAIPLILTSFKNNAYNFLKSE